MAASVPGVNLGMVGLILMVGGGIWLLVGMLTGAMKSTATTQTHTVAQDPAAPGGQRVVYSEVRSEY